MAAVTICSDFGAPKIKSDTVSPCISHEVVGPDAMIFVIVSPALAGRFFTTEPPGKPTIYIRMTQNEIFRYKGNKNCTKSV